MTIESHRWIEPEEAAAYLGISVLLLRKLTRSSRNPPPFIRPSARLMLFDREALTEWKQRTWQQ